MNVTPADVVDRYRTLVVTPDPPGEGFVVPVTNYACERVGNGTGQAERAAMRDRVKARFRTDPDQLGLTEDQVGWAFRGAGLPDEIARVIRLMIRYGFYTHAGPPRPGLNGAAMKAAARSITAGPPVYIGLDCTGFVGAWARLAGFPQGSRDRGAIDWVDGGVRLHTELGQIEPGDVVSWANRSHVVVIQSCTPAVAGARSRDVVIAESDGRGIGPFPATVTLCRTGQVSIRLGGRATAPAFRITIGHHGNPEVYIGTLNAVRQRKRSAPSGATPPASESPSLTRQPPRS